VRWRSAAAVSCATRVFQVDLRTVAPSAAGDRITVQGGEDVDGYAGNWSVVVYAMCAPRPPGYEIVVIRALANPTDSRKADTAICPAGGAMSNGGFEGRHVVGVPIREEVAGLLIDDADIEATGQDPRIALLRQVRIKCGDRFSSLIGREQQHTAHERSVWVQFPGACEFTAVTPGVAAVVVCRGLSRSHIRIWPMSGRLRKMSRGRRSPRCPGSRHVRAA
jgi:hypothetical protein